MDTKPAAKPTTAILEVDAPDPTATTAVVAADLADRLRGLWEALAYLEQEADRIVTTPDVGILVGCARMALERHYGGTPPPEPGRANRLN